MQTIAISGNLAADAELRSTQGGDQVLSFRVGVRQGYGDRSSTNWFRCNVWGKRGASLERLMRKGMKVVVQGELTIGEYEGKPQYEIRANEVELMQKAEGEQRQSGGGETQHYAPASWDDLDSDSVPFAYPWLSNDHRSV